MLAVGVALCVAPSNARASDANSLNAHLCDLSPVVQPDGFPDQPINIIIPRSQSSGALRLSAELVAALPAIPDDSGAMAPPEVNLLFKSNGDLAAALAYFSRLPANGYNVIQLNDTYASLMAKGTVPDPGLVPVFVGQITFSQIYVRSDDPRFDGLESFRDYARAADTDTMTIANFDTRDGSTGLEDFLIDRFITSNELRAKTAPAQNAGRTRGGSGGPQEPLHVQGYENGSERYFSLFSRVRADLPQSDALIEQPGDVARLLEAGLITPIHTLLPENLITDDLVARLGDTPGFPDAEDAPCIATFRYRGFFVSEEVPEAERKYLAWLFQTAFGSARFQDFNRTQYMDVLYDNPEIAAAYCDADVAAAVFEQSIENYRQCFASLSTH